MYDLTEEISHVRKHMIRSLLFAGTNFGANFRNNFEPDNNNISSM